jgi:hypothetical protein
VFSVRYELQCYEHGWGGAVAGIDKRSKLIRGREKHD